MSVVERVLPHEDLFRAAYPAVEMRDADSARPTLFGHFSVFNVWTEINSRYEGHFLERFAPGSFKRTFSQKKGFIPPLLEHGQDPSVWKKPLGDVLDLCEDGTGAYYEVSLYDVHYVREILPAIVSGHYGASFRFSAPLDNFVRNPGVSVWNPKGIPERTVLEAAVAEFSLVLFPAYREATAGVRSLTDFYNPKALQQALEDFNAAQESLRESREHVERVSVFIDEHHLHTPDEVAEVAEVAGSTQTFTWTSNATTPVNVTYTVPPGYALVPLGAEHTAETPQAAEVEAEVRDEEPEANTREQDVNRLYQRSYQVLGESIWAVHPGMLEVYLNIMAERRAGYRPTQAEIDERIGQRGIESTPESFDGEMAADVAVINIAGSIMPHGGAMSNASQRGCNVEDLQADFMTAIKDENVKAVMFNIDSPGGSVDLIPEFGQAIMDARGTKPIVAMVNTMAASAAYWIASACDKVYVTPSGEVGSIGVYSCHSDLSEKLAMEGVKKTFVSAGKYKVDGNPYEPLSAEAEADMQGKVDTYYQMFVDAVAAGRGVDSKVAQAKFGQGRMVLADEAVILGMADAVLTLDEALKTLDPAAEAPVPEEEDDEDVVPAPPDDEPELPDDGPDAHLGSEAREPEVNIETEDEPSWRI